MASCSDGVDFEWPTWHELVENITRDVEEKITGHAFFAELCTCCRPLFHYNAGEQIFDAKNAKLLLRQIEILLTTAWEHLNTGHWRDVPVSWRYMYSYASLAKAKAVSLIHKDLKSCVTAIDMGILLGAPICNGCLPHLAKSIHKKIILAERNEKLEKKQIIKVLDETNIPTLPQGIKCYQTELRPIPNITVTEFMLNHFNLKKPCIIKSLAENWPAFTKWRDLAYFRKIGGYRTVPVEIGGRYTDSDWGQKLMLLSQYIDEYVLAEDNDSKKGYLAQHQLLDQIIELKSDIVVPDYCFVAAEDMNDDEDTRVEINAWLGPKTVSPMHQDPKDNILTQVVGVKYFHLFDPAETEFLYPFETDRMLSNTSQVDLLNVDLSKFPNFAKTRSGCFGYLNPGDALYIPAKWWHFVSSLSNWSCSVSFWF